MHRCLQLAGLGAGNVAPNPMVGAVLVYNDIIIGEGYHQQYGMPHAEVNCINNVSETDKPLIEKSTLYVSLEPCSHFGKTPPCSDLIIQQKISTVVIACRDTYHEVNGKGIEKLTAAGVTVITGVLEKQAQDINQHFFVYQNNKRPFIILKWAQSSDGKIAGQHYKQVAISNPYTNRLVHKWRSETAAIIVGTNTALHDNPSLTNRFFSGNNPVRILLDKDLKIPLQHHLLNGQVKTIVFNSQKESIQHLLEYIKIDFSKNVLEQILTILFLKGIQSLLVEGGAIFLQSFIDIALWDEARVIKNTSMTITEGIEAPLLSNSTITKQHKILTDTITYYQHKL